MFKKFLEKKGVEDIKSLSAEKQAELYNEFNGELLKQVESLEAASATKEEIQSVKAELSGAIEKQFVSLNEVLKAQGVAMKRIIDKEAPANENKSVKDLLFESKDALVKLKNEGGAQNNVKIVVKAVGDMSIGGNTTGQIPQAYRNPVIGDVKERQIKLLDLVSTGAISSNLYEWVYVANEEGAAGATGEGLVKNQIDFELIVGSQKVEKITAFLTVTDEMLDDVEGINTLINNKLSIKLEKALESGVYGGSGVSPILNGIRTVATAFAAGSFATDVENPNSIDVLVVAANQIALSEQGMPTAVLMNPTDIARLKLEKVTSTDKRYVQRLAEIGGSLSMDGVPLVPTTLVTAGEYLIGDFTKASLLFKQGVTIEIGYNADNFVKNFKSIRAELRAVCAVENNERSAFVKGVFATDITAITKP